MNFSRFRESIAEHWLRSVIVSCTAIIVVAACIIWSRPAKSANPANAANNVAGGTSLGYTTQDRPAPAFSLPRLTGQGSIQLSALRGKPIVLNFWSSSCTVCMQESPAIAQVARASQNRVAFVGIDVYDVRKAAIAFVDKYHLPYQMAFDSEGVAASKYDVPALPETFFLSGSGQKILAINLGALTSTRLKAILRSLYGITV